MKYIKNLSTSPFFNLALEEYVLKHIDSQDDYFLLWQNEPSIIVGKHQNTVEEINSNFVKENGINVVRRISGGGAVYHDLGNLNFTFIVKNVKREAIDFKRFAEPIVKTLEKFGVKAEVSGRNDITIEGKKFSGNAQHFYKKRLLHHGTILFDSDLEVLQQALNVKADKFKSKGVKSVKSRVTNLVSYLPENVDIDEFKSVLIETIFEYFGKEYDEHKLQEEDYDKINKLVEEKYSTWEWNYGESPEFNFKNSKRFKGGKVEVLLDVKQGIIANCKIYGDFLGLVDINEFQQKIKGIKYDEQEVFEFLKQQDLGLYFGNIDAKELLSCFFA